MRRRVAFVTVSSALLLAFSSAPASGQSLGVKGGATFSTIAVDPSDALGEPGYGPAVGVLGGVYLTFRDTARFSIEVAGQVAIRRVSFNSEPPSSEISTSLTYVEVPVVVRYPVFRLMGKRIVAIGGASANMRLAASESSPGDPSRDVKDAFKALEVAAVLGALVELGSKLSAEVRYFVGSDTFSEDDVDLKARQQGWQFIVAYRLR